MKMKAQCASYDPKLNISFEKKLTIVFMWAVVSSLIWVFLMAMSGVAVAAVPSNSNGVWDDPGTVPEESFNYNHPQQYANPPGSDTSGWCDRCHDMGGEMFAVPHGGYTTATNKCRDCHAVHRASGEFVLTRADDEYTACDYCHGTGSGSGRKVQMADPGVSNGHHLGYSGYAPDTDEDTPYLVDGFTCHDCHSVHATDERMVLSIDHSMDDIPAGVILPHSGGLLLGRPNPANTEDHAFCGEVVDMTDWCSSCHEGNGAIDNGGGPKDHQTPMVVYDNITDSFEEAYSHDSQTDGMALGGSRYELCDNEVTDPAYPYVDPQDGVNQGPTCNECHASEWISEFPHRSDGYALLKPGASDSSLDDVCLDCHLSDALP